MKTVVVDASVFVALFLSEPASAAALRMFKASAQPDGPLLWAPDAVYYEVMGALRRATVNRAYSTWLEDVRRLAIMPIRVAPSNSLMVAATQFSMKHNISTYDAFYAVLALNLGVPLITLDERLARALDKKVTAMHVDRFVA